MFVGCLERRHRRTGHGTDSSGGVPGVGHGFLDGRICFSVPHQKSYETRRYAGHGQTGKTYDPYRRVQRLVHRASRSPDPVFDVRARESRFLDRHVAFDALPRPQIRAALSHPDRRPAQETQLRGVHSQIFCFPAGRPYVERLDLVRQDAEQLATVFGAYTAQFR